MLIEVAYAKPEKQIIISVDVEEACTIENAIKQSEILSQFSEIDLEQNKVGIFGKAAKLTDTLRENDRIEIYRPLIADPKESRRARAAKKERKAK